MCQTNTKNNAQSVLLKRFSKWLKWCFYTESFQFYFQKNSIKVTSNLIFSRQLQAFVHEYPFLRYYISKQRDCKLQLVGAPVAQASFGVAVRKGSSWKYRLSQSILKYKEGNKLTKLEAKWLTGACQLNTTSTTLESLQFTYFGGLYLILVTALGLSVFLLGLEHCCSRYHRHMTDPVHKVAQVLRKRKPDENGQNNFFKQCCQSQGRTQGSTNDNRNCYIIGDTLIVNSSALSNGQSCRHGRPKHSTDNNNLMLRSFVRS